jgi:hypothetical protein
MEIFNSEALQELLSKLDLYSDQSIDISEPHSSSPGSRPLNPNILQRHNKQANLQQAKVCDCNKPLPARPLVLNLI